MSQMFYVLTDEDMEIVKNSVQKRIETSGSAGLNHATTYKRDMSTRIKEESIGVAAELAWARLNNREWHDPLNEFHHVPDDGKYEIRATDHPGGGLIIRNNDPDNRKYIFVIVEGRRCDFYGWAYGHEAKNDAHAWNPRGLRPAWRMSRKELHSLKMLNQ